MPKKRVKQWKNQNAWERTRTVGGGAIRLATATGSAASNSRVATYVKGKRQQRKDSRTAAKEAAQAEKQRRQANRAAILEAHNNGGFVESDANGNIKYVGQRRAKVKTHQRTVNGKTITVAANGMTKGEARSTGRPRANRAATPQTSQPKRAAPAFRADGQPWTVKQLDSMSKMGIDIQEASRQHSNDIGQRFVRAGRGGTVKQHSDAQMRRLKMHGITMILFALFLFPTAARAQAQPCLLTGGEPPITVLVGPQMNLTEYHLLKSAMGHDDLMEHEFLKVLRSYCPDDLQGVDKLSLHIDHQPTALILHESTRAAQRAAYADAQRDHGSYTVYAEAPEEGIGILYHANGWRMDKNGDWRSPTGGYAPTDPRHDPFQNMPDCWHTQSCNGPAPTAAQTRAGLLAIRDYASEVVNGPTVIDGSGPVPTAEPPIVDGLQDEKPSLFGRFRWVASFIGTIFILIVLGGLVALGISIVGSMREAKSEPETMGKYGLGVVSPQMRGVSK